MELMHQQHVFFAGIGGISMSGLAHALLDAGFSVSGSDIAEGDTVRRLRETGARITIGHEAANIAGADVIVRTTAVPDDSPEIVAATAAGLPVYHRSELLAWMCRGKRAIAVAGTHGKSTTTAMLGTMLMGMGVDPTVFVGAELPNINGNYRIGQGEHIVFEACESDGSFLNYKGCSEVITSCEPDHLDQHKTFEHVKASFGQFAGISDPEGFIVYRADCPVVCGIAEGGPGRKVSFSLTAQSDISARDVRILPDGSEFGLTVGGELVCGVRVNAVGEHNVLNALAAFGAIHGSGLDVRSAAQALGSYAPIGRRFEQVGQVGGARVIDDYAHHPTEIRATLRAARQTHPGRIIAVFQPHLASRTRDLLAEFGSAFAQADVVVLTSVYQPRRDGVDEFDMTRLVEEIQGNEPGKPVELVGDMWQIPAHLAPRLKAGDLVLTIGAGDINKVAHELVKSSE